MALSTIPVVAVTPTVAAASYAAGKIIGGKLQFAIPTGGGTLDRIRITSKGVRTGTLKFYLFNSDPSATTWTDNTTPAIAAADVPLLKGEFILSSPTSALGTHTLWQATSVGRAFSSQTLYGVVVNGSVTFDNSAGITSDLAVELAIIANIDAVPVNTAVPAISGTAKVGEILTALPGTWLNIAAGTTIFTFQWNKSGTGAIAGATDSTYTPVEADIGHTITVTVVAKNPDGNSLPATSAATAAVAAAAPANTDLPAIDGDPLVGATLTASPGSWINTPTAFAYQWNRGQTPIGGATAATYVTVTADIGAVLEVAVSASNAGGAGSATSPPTSTILDLTHPGISVTVFGAAGDGIADDTAALQLASDSGLVLWVPATIDFYKTTRVVQLHNSVFSDGAEIRLQQDGTASTSILRVIENRVPVTLDDLVLNGGYVTGTAAGEDSAGIDLLSAANITLNNCTIKNTAGDNIYMSYGGNVSAPCRNITISNNMLLNPYRANFTFGSSRDVSVIGNTISKLFDYKSAIRLTPMEDGVSNNRNITFDTNQISCVNRCMNVLPNKTILCTGLRMINNTVTALANFFTGVCAAPYFKGNRFSATDYGADPDNAAMFIFLAHCLGIMLDGNIDSTSLGSGVYQSLVLRGNSTVALNINNVFVAHLSTCPEIPWAFLSADTDCGLTAQAVSESEDMQGVLGTLCPAMLDLGAVV